MRTQPLNAATEMWPMLNFGPINLYSLPPAWRCGSDSDLVAPAPHVSTPRPLAASGTQARLAELMRNRG